MFRRISVGTLALALVTVATPRAALAEDLTSSPTTGQVARVAADLAKPHALDLQNAGRGIALAQGAKAPSKQESGSFWSTPHGKVVLAATILTAAVLICYAAAQGPTPTSGK
jgi:hypothetical protein